MWETLFTGVKKRKKNLSFHFISPYPAWLLLPCVSPLIIIYPSHPLFTPPTHFFKPLTLSTFPYFSLSPLLLLWCLSSCRGKCPTDALATVQGLAVFINNDSSLSPWTLPITANDQCPITWSWSSWHVCIHKYTRAIVADSTEGFPFLKCTSLLNRNVVPW